MNKRTFLKTAGLASFASLLPFGRKSLAETNATNTCALIPTETAGPFPLDLTTNSFYFRQDVREDKPGVQLNLRLKITGLNNCEPMSNLRVNIWHCDKDGVYSGYSSQGSAGQTYLRGYQMTDANGEVEFITIFPGWYNGRICHIHFQVFVSSVYAAVSQLTFDLAAKNAIYTANPTIYTDGIDPLGFDDDNIFSDGYEYQIASLNPNTTTGGYDAYLEVAIQGSGTATGLGALAPETGGQFTLGQNFPNPYTDETIVPFSLTQLSDVEIELWDLSGKKVAVISQQNMKAGEHKITFNTKSLGIANGNYVYQLQVTNLKGSFRQCKMMTSAQ